MIDFERQEEGFDHSGCDVGSGHVEFLQFGIFAKRSTETRNDFSAHCLDVVEVEDSQVSVISS